MRKVLIFFLPVVLLLFYAGQARATEPPVLLSPPTISGDKQIFEPQELDRGTWENMSPGSYFQQWQRRVGGEWQDIAYALGLNYFPNNFDVGRYLRAEVTAYNGYGNTTAYTQAYYIRGTGVNGVEIFPAAPAVVSMKSNGIVRMGRVLCNEGLCKIGSVRVKIIVAGRSYRAKAFFPKSRFKAGKTMKIRFRVPRSLRYSLPGKVRMRVRAYSTNRDSRTRVLRRSVSY